MVVAIRSAVEVRRCWSATGRAGLDPRCSVAGGRGKNNCGRWQCGGWVDGAMGVVGRRRAVAVRAASRGRRMRGRGGEQLCGGWAEEKETVMQWIGPKSHSATNRPSTPRASVAPLLLHHRPTLPYPLRPHATASSSGNLLFCHHRRWIFTRMPSHKWISLQCHSKTDATRYNAFQFFLIIS